MSSSSTRLAGKQQNLARASGHAPIRRRLLVLSSPLASAHTSAPGAATSDPSLPRGAAKPHRHRQREGQGGCAHRIPSPSPITIPITTARCGAELPASPRLPCRAADPTTGPERRKDASQCGGQRSPPASTSPAEKPKSPPEPEKIAPAPPPLAVSPLPHPQAELSLSARAPVRPPGRPMS